MRLPPAARMIWTVTWCWSACARNSRWKAMCCCAGDSTKPTGVSWRACSVAPHPAGRAVVVLAAGHGTRMGGPKAFTRFGDRTFLERILDRCAESDAEVTVTVDPTFKERVLALIKSRPVPRPHLHLRWVEADGKQPMLASIHAALAAGGFEHGFWLWPVDAPFLSSAGWRRLSD